MCIVVHFIVDGILTIFTAVTVLNGLEAAA